MENNENKKSVKFQGDMLNFCDFIQVFVFTPNHHLKGSSQHQVGGEWFEIELGKISRMLVKYEVLPIPNVISVC